MIPTIFIFALTVAGPEGSTPPISQAKLDSASAAGGLERAVAAAIAKQTGPAWIGYLVPRVSRPAGDGQSCCWNDRGVGCGLEGKRSGNAPAASAPRPIKLEGPTHIAVLLRSEQGVVGKLRAFTEDCPLDAGGLPMHWLTQVKPAESVALLMKYLDGEGRGRKSLGDEAVHALAEHAAPEAAAALENVATSGQRSESLRKKAIFWLANARGRPGYLVVSRLLREDASDKIREHAVFALTQSREPEAIPAIIKVAREDRSPQVRGQALFGLAQEASRKQAAETISAAIERDPDTEVKKKAVFALTQMPSDEGVPLLLQVARTNANAAVRKQAMFWLGQSKDPRALKFFEEVLAK
jgi:HEAT repeat protein